MGDEVRCPVCGESECWALADWSMGGAPGEYEEAMAKHYRLGYEREKARAGAAEAREATLAAANAALADSVTRCAGIESDLAAARRDIYRLLTGARENLYMEADHERCIDCGALVIDSHKPTCRVPGPRGAAVAAPAACVTPNGRTDGHGSYVERQPDGSWICTFCKRPVDGAAPAAGEEGRR